MTFSYYKTVKLHYILKNTIWSLNVYERTLFQNEWFPITIQFSVKKHNCIYEPSIYNLLSKILFTHFLSTVEDSSIFI